LGPKNLYPLIFLSNKQRIYQHFVKNTFGIIIIPKLSRQLVPNRMNGERVQLSKTQISHDTGHSQST